MLVNKRIQHIRERATKAGERNATVVYRRELKDIEKNTATNTRKLKRLHTKEVKQVQRQVDVQIKRLQKKELDLERAMSAWNEKIEQADHYLLEAKNTLYTQFVEKKEIFQRMARHIAEESSAIEKLLSNVNEHKLKVLKTNPVYLKRG